MSWARESDLPVGPMLPATKTCLGALSATVLAILAAAQANSAALSCIPYAAWEILEALKELVVMMSAPASTYSEWMPAMISGWLMLNSSLLPEREWRWSIVPMPPSRMSILSRRRSLMSAIF